MNSPPPSAPDPTAPGEDVLTAAFTAQRPRLLRTVRLHLDARLLGRVDPDDVLQECYLEARRRLAPAGDQHDEAMFVWLRRLARQAAVDAARRHLGAERRSLAREIALDAQADTAATAAALQHALLSRLTSPTQAASRAELGQRVAAAIAAMSGPDQEILLLRHFEELTNNETAATLGIHKAAATNRYLRALRRLREVLPAEFGGPT